MHYDMWAVIKIIMCANVIYPRQEITGKKEKNDHYIMQIK